MSSPKLPRSNDWTLGRAPTSLIPLLVFDHPSGLRVLTSWERTADGDWYHVSASREAAPVSDPDLSFVRAEFGMSDALEENSSPAMLDRLRAEGRKLGRYPVRHLWLPEERDHSAARSRSSAAATM